MYLAAIVRRTELRAVSCLCRAFARNRLLPLLLSMFSWCICAYDYKFIWRERVCVHSSFDVCKKALSHISSRWALPKVFFNAYNKQIFIYLFVISTRLYLLRLLIGKSIIITIAISEKRDKGREQAKDNRPCVPDLLLGHTAMRTMSRGDDWLSSLFPL